MRNRFDQELASLHDLLHRNGHSCPSRPLRAAKDALLAAGCGQLARQAHEYEREVDEREREVERRCLKLLLQQQPVASDLRDDLHCLEDHHRSGAHLRPILRHRRAGGPTWPDQPYIKQLVDIPKMAEAVIKMVKESIDAFVAPATSTWPSGSSPSDDVVDDLFNQVKNDLIALIRKDANNGEQAVDLLMVAKYLERIGDHATNVAEWVVFSITGEHKNETRAVSRMGRNERLSEPAVDLSAWKMTTASAN